MTNFDLVVKKHRPLLFSVKKEFHISAVVVPEEGKCKFASRSHIYLVFGGYAKAQMQSQDWYYNKFVYKNLIMKPAPG